jgi:hypothetical protein
MQRRSLRLPTIAAIAVSAALLGACGSDAQIGDLVSGSTVPGEAAPAPTDAPEAPAPTDAPEAPAPTDAPAEPTPTTATPDDGTSDDDNDWLVPVLIIGGLLLLAVIIGGVIGRSKKSTPAQTNAAAATPQSSLLSTSQWITDQLTLELMAAEPAAAQQRWTVERSRLDNVAVGAQQQYLEAGDPNWQPLAQTMSALAAAIDTNLQLRAQDPPNAQLINESVEVVNRHRTAAQQLVAALRPTIQR